jgi:hypothetical protein
MGMNRLLTVILLGLVFLVGRAAAADPDISLAVKRSHLIGSSAGTLRFTPLGVEYATEAKAEARRWTYSDIKQLQIVSPKRISVLTYEDQGWVKFGADRRFDFEVREGSISAEIVAFILAHIDRPVVTAVLPPIAKSPMYRLLVNHERHGRGSDGVLLLFDDALVYGTERAEDTRYWRFADVFAVLPIDRDRLQVVTYEGGAGDLRTFTFELKSEMPEAFRRALWSRVNPPAPFTASSNDRVASAPGHSR